MFWIDGHEVSISLCLYLLKDKNKSTGFCLCRSMVPLPPFGLPQVDAAQQSSQFLCRDLLPPLLGICANRNCVRAFLQTFAPDRESVTIPVQDLHAVFPAAGENEQMPGKCVQLQ